MSDKNINKNRELIEEVNEYLKLSFKTPNFTFYPERYINSDDLLYSVKLRLAEWDSHCNLYYEPSSEYKMHYRVNSHGYTYITLCNITTNDDMYVVMEDLYKIKDKITKKWVLNFAHNMKDEPFYVFMSSLLTQDFVLDIKDAVPPRCIVKITHDSLTLSNAHSPINSKIKFEGIKKIIFSDNIPRRVGKFLNQWPNGKFYFRVPITNYIIHKLKIKKLSHDDVIIRVPIIIGTVPLTGDNTILKIDEEIDKKYWPYS